MLVTVAGPAPHLRACLDSILDQSGEDIELVLVDESADAPTGRILIEYASGLRGDAPHRADQSGRRARHDAAGAPGSVPVRLAGADGPDPAGGHVWFVEPDTLLAEGAARAVVRRLRETGPDLLLLDQAELDWAGGARRGPASALLATAGAPDVVTLAERPALARLDPRTTVTVVKRSLLDHVGLDLTDLTQAAHRRALLEVANRIATLDRVCLLRRPAAAPAGRRPPRAAARPPVRLARSVGRGGRAVGRGVRRAWYHLHLRLPLDRRLALFTALGGRGYLAHPAAVHRAATRLAPHVRGVVAVRRDARSAVPQGVSTVVIGGFAWHRAMARARWVVSDTPLGIPAQVARRRPGATHVHLHHGVPLSGAGLDRAASVAEAAAVAAASARWDVALSASPHATEVWRRAYPGRHEIWEIGQPRLDGLVRAGAAAVERARALYGLEPGQTSVLYAPTGRDYRPQGRRGLLLDAEWLADELGPDVVVLQRHGDTYAPGSTARHPRVRDVSRHLVLEPLLLASDVLITDYSAVICDFVLLDRPIVLHAPDWDSFRRTTGVAVDLLADPPGLVVRDAAELRDAWRADLLDGPEAADARARLRRWCCPNEDGRAAERLVSRLFLDPVLGGQPPAS
ncbi:CDP-glycerol glycerophosphotransferase family protein [Luedemannella helvata]|uniref:Glycosyltransferase n=1 Tax=Luedemannella helvata TaxID=349315 RepID=A0ABP4W1D7_9ACTN